MLTEKLFHFLLLSCSVFILSACGGGDIGDGLTPPAENNISGTVSAPGGAIAMFENKIMFAKIIDTIFPPANAVITGISPVAGAKVELIEINKAGNQVGDVLATVTTGSDGSYSLKTTRLLDSDLALRVEGNVPEVKMRAMVNGTSVNITPVSEYVLTEIIAAITRTNGATLTHFTNNEIQTLLDTINSLTVDLSGTLANSVAALDAQAPAEFSNTVNETIAVPFSGTWDYTNTLQSHNCSVPILNTNGTVTITQDGTQLTINRAADKFVASISDDIVTWTDSDKIPSIYGEVTYTEQVTITVTGTTAEGTTNWTLSGGLNCSGRYSLAINKV